MEIFGIILLVVGFILFFVQRNEKQKLFSIQSARLMTAAELAETAGVVAAEIGGGSWRDYVKIWGEVVAESPLYSEHKQAACVHYISRVEREYEKIETTKDEEGNVKTERRQTSEQVAANRQTMPFWLRDRTGTIKIDPDGADIETIQIMNEFRPERSGDTLGYRYHESILPVGREVLVVGAVSDLTGDVIIGKPIQSAHKYIISLKNEEALAAATGRNAEVLFYVMVGCLVAGGGLLVLSLFT